MPSKFCGYPLNAPYEEFSRRPADFMTLLYAAKAAEETHSRITDTVIEAYERGGNKPDSRVQVDLGHIKHDLGWITTQYDVFTSNATQNAAQALADAFRVFRGDIGSFQCHLIFYVRSANVRAIADECYLLYCQCLPVLNMVSFALEHWLDQNPNGALTGFPSLNV